MLVSRGFVPIKLAQTLKLMVTRMLYDFGIPTLEMPRYIEGDLKELPIPGLGRSPRYLFQTLGTEWGRRIVHPKVWTDIAINRIRAEMVKGHSVVVDDMRFPNELEALTEAGGITVRVVRPGVTALEGHESEGLLDDTPMAYELVNDGTLDDLAASVATLVEDVRL